MLNPRFFSLLFIAVLSLNLTANADKLEDTKALITELSNQEPNWSEVGRLLRQELCPNLPPEDTKNTIDSHLRRALRQAFEHDNGAAVSLLVPLLRTRLSLLEPLLFYAASYGKAAAITALISLGFHCDIRDSTGLTPLCYAVIMPFGAPALQALIAAGANVNVFDIFESSPLDAALRRGDDRVTAALLSAGALPSDTSLERKL